MDENNNIPGAAASSEPGQPGQLDSRTEPMQAENPFAGFAAQPEAAAASACEASQPAVAPATQPEPAPAPEFQPAPQPYYEASAQPAQPACAPCNQTAAQQGYTPYGQAAAVQQPTYAPYDASGYGTYGTSGQPPVPPAPPVQNIYPGYEPPNSGQKRRWPWFLLGLAVGLVIGLGGCASCVGVMALADYGSSDGSYDDSYLYDYDDSYNYDYEAPDLWAPEDSYGTDEDSSAYGGFTIDEIAAVFEADGISQGTPGEGDVCAKGFYAVGPKGAIPAGLYYLEGSNEKLSHYYVFDGDDGRYNLDDSVQYFGNYFVDLDEGDLIVFDPGEDVTMRPAPSTSTDPQAPYTNGCYRVGIDIPAGSYTITAATVGEGETEDDSAAYVMKDLDFDEGSIVDEKYVIPGGEQTVTVSNGQYLELFAATATPVAQG